jgi:hypothetical protein
MYATREPDLTAGSTPPFALFIEHEPMPLSSTVANFFPFFLFTAGPQRGLRAG